MCSLKEWRIFDMDKINHQDDLLAGLFDRLPEEEPSLAFQRNVMQQVLQEEQRRQKRNEWLELLVTVVVSLFVLFIAIAVFVYSGLFRFDHLDLDLDCVRFYLLIGSLSFFLWMADYKLRKVFGRDK